VSANDQLMLTDHPVTVPHAEMLVKPQRQLQVLARTWTPY